jgi:hypothetical protein
MNGSVSFEYAFRMPQSVRKATLDMLQEDQNKLPQK